MKRLSVMPFVVAVGLILVPLMQRASQAADVTFSVKQATYSGTGGVFRCEAKLSAGDTATVTFTVPEAQADTVFASVHTSYPAKLSRAAPNSKKEVAITVAVESSTTVTAGVTYRTQFVLDDSYSIRYGIQRLANEGEISKLSAYLHVHDRSYSNAQWSNAKLVVKRPAVNDLCRVDVNMDAGKTYISPITDLASYGVKLASPTPSYYRTLGEQAFNVLQLANQGDQTLPAGSIRVMSAAGSLLHGTELRADLPSGQSADLLVEPVPSKQLSVKRVATDDRWYEVTALSYGMLEFRQWPTKETTIKNNGTSPLYVYDELRKGPQKVCPGRQHSWIEKGKPAAGTASTDLFDLSNEKLELHVVKLREFEEIPDTWKGEDEDNCDENCNCIEDSGPKNDLEEVIAYHDSILKLTKKIESISSSIETTVARIAELTAARANRDVIDFYEERKAKLTMKQVESKNTIKEKTVELANKLRAMDTGS